MVTTFLQLRQTLRGGGHLYLFTVFVALIWIVWVLKVALSRRYRPWVAPVQITSSVVIPVVDEPLELFEMVLQRIVDQAPHEVVVVINGPRNEGLEGICEQFADVTWHWTPTPGKRNAVRVGVEQATGEVVVLVDSDTLWTDGTLDELVKPFADHRVGGVTTRQRILDPDRGFLTRWADWLESSRSLYSMPAQSMLGQVGCLPGRTIAFRRRVLEDVMHDFLTQRFLGILLEVSDDRTLTNLTLKAGYRTVYQSTSLVFTDAPTHLRKMAKQQLRWARGSQYNTLRMLPWMLAHAPVLAFFFTLDMVLPFLWVCSALGWVGRALLPGHAANLYDAMSGYHHRRYGLVAVVALIALSSWLSMTLRQHRHLQTRLGDVALVPLYIVFSTLFLMPIRIYGFARLGRDSAWGTRAHAYTAGTPTGAEAASAAVGGAGGLTGGAGGPTGWSGGPPGGGVAVADRPSAACADTAARTAAHPSARTSAHPSAHPCADPARVRPTHRRRDPRGAIPYAITAIAILGGTLYDCRLL